MQLIKNNYKFRCEIGGCCNYADYALLMDRTGIHSRILLCKDCAKKMLEAVRETLAEKTDKLEKDEKSENNAGLSRDNAGKDNLNVDGVSDNNDGREKSKKGEKDAFEKSGKSQKTEAGGC